MNRPPIPPEQLSGKVIRAQETVLKAQRGADKLYDRFMETLEDDALDRWLKALDRVYDAQEEETRLMLMVYNWRQILQEDTKKLNADVQETTAKLSNLREKEIKTKKYLNLLF